MTTSKIRADNERSRGLTTNSGEPQIVADFGRQADFLLGPAGHSTPGIAGRQFGKPRRFLRLTRRQGRGNRRRISIRRGFPCPQATKLIAGYPTSKLANVGWPRKATGPLLHEKGAHKGRHFCVKKTRQRPTFPQNHSCSIIGAVELNFRVRDGNGCRLYAMVTGKLFESINFIDNYICV